MVREGYYSELIRDEAFRSVWSHLGDMQKRVFETIDYYGPISNEDIAHLLNVFPHTITPRVLELRQYNLVEYAGEKIAKSGRKASLWRVKPPQTQLSLFN